MFGAGQPLCDIGGATARVGQQMELALERELGLAGLGYDNDDELPDRILRWIARGLLALLIALVAIVSSPANLTTPLFLLPDLVPAVICDEMVAAAEAHADSVGGWLTERHRNYPTTDFQLWSIPAATAIWNSTMRDLVMPAVAGHHGRPLESLVLRDVFIVKYEGGGGAQNALRLHRDASLLSFNLALSSPTDYAGGGTAIPLLGSDPTLGAPLRIGKGTLLTHQSSLLHAGAETTAGTRYLLVGFVDLAGFWDRHGWHRTWGLTASCVNITTMATIRPPRAGGHGYPLLGAARHEWGGSSKRTVCPGLLTAAAILRGQLYAELADAGGHMAGLPVLPVVLGLCCTAIALLSVSLAHDGWKLRCERRAWIAQYHQKYPKQA